MSDNSPSPQEQVIQLATAHWVSRLIHLAAELRISDFLSDGPRTADELAGLTATHPPTLYRVMRTMASLGFFTEDSLHRFSLTPFGETLRTGTPGSVRASVLTLSGPWFNAAFDHLLYSVQTGKTGFEKVYGMNVFDWLGQHPVEASLFSETMVGVHGAEPAAVAAAYDFPATGTIIDVGGGTGNLLTTILGRHPGPRGILYDLPHVTRDAPAMVQARSLADRVTIKTGSFFESVPEGGDVYLLSHIIHDWSEAHCLTILGNCRRAMKPDSRLLIVEMVLPTGDTPHPGKILDIVMLVAPGGQERTASEYESLLDKAGLRLNRVVPTQSAVSVVEALVA